MDRSRRARALGAAELRLLGGAVDVRAVGSWLLGGAGAAPVLVGAGRVLEFRQPAAERDEAGGVERVEDVEGAREATEGVVATRGREVVRPAVEVDCVGPPEGDDRRAVLERLGR